MSEPGAPLRADPANHDHLQARLARHIAGQNKRAAWQEISFSDCRADVFSVDISRGRFTDPHIHEVKATRSDFLSDINTGKWRKYLAHSAQFNFATAAGICARDEIPDEAGWLEYDAGVWRRRKRCQKRDVEVGDDFLIKVALYRMPHMPVGRAWTEDQWVTHLERKKVISHKVAAILREQSLVEARLERLKAECCEVEARIHKLRAAETHPSYLTADLFEEMMK